MGEEFLGESIFSIESLPRFIASYVTTIRRILFNLNQSLEPSHSYLLCKRSPPQFSEKRGFLASKVAIIMFNK